MATLGKSSTCLYVGANGMDEVRQESLRRKADQEIKGVLSRLQSEAAGMIDDVKGARTVVVFSKESLK